MWSPVNTWPSVASVSLMESILFSGIAGFWERQNSLVLFYFHSKIFDKPFHDLPVDKMENCGQMI